MRKFGNSEFSTKPTNLYNLDVIISVGYRVKSQRGVQFRIWAKHLDRILVSTGEKLLTGNGMISHERAMEKAELEYKKYKQKTLSNVKKDYLEIINGLEKSTKK